MIEAAGQDDFVQFMQPGIEVPEGFGTGNEDKVTQLVVAQTIQKSIPWKQSQDALRGVVMDRDKTSVIDTFSTASFAQARLQVRQAPQALASSVENAQQKAQKAANQIGKSLAGVGSVIAETVD